MKLNLINRKNFAVAGFAGVALAAVLVCYQVVSHSMTAEEASLAKSLHGAPSDVTAVECDPALAGKRHCAVAYGNFGLKTDVVVPDDHYPAASFSVMYTPPRSMATPFASMDLQEQVSMATNLDLTSVSREQALQWIRPVMERAAGAADARLGDALTMARQKEAVASSYR